MCSQMKRWIRVSLIVLVLPLVSRGLQIPLAAHSQTATDSRPIPTEIPDASVEFTILKTDEVRFLEPSLDLVVSSFRKDERIVIVDYYLGKDSQDRDRIVRLEVDYEDEGRGPKVSSLDRAVTLSIVDKVNLVALSRSQELTDEIRLENGDLLRGSLIGRTIFNGLSLLIEAPLDYTVKPVISKNS